MSGYKNLCIPCITGKPNGGIHSISDFSNDFKRADLVANVYGQCNQNHGSAVFRVALQWISSALPWGASKYWIARPPPALAVAMEETTLPVGALMAIVAKRWPGVRRACQDGGDGVRDNGTCIMILCRQERGVFLSKKACRFLFLNSFCLSKYIVWHHRRPLCKASTSQRIYALSRTLL